MAPTIAPLDAFPLELLELEAAGEGTTTVL
jgi:hypothetical protein